jgi:hypothetical protein
VNIQDVLLAVCLMGMTEGPSAAQQRPLETQDPAPVGAGRVVVESGVTYMQREFYPLSGLEGNLWQLPLLNFAIGVSSIADFQLSGGPYDRLEITGRRAAPLAALVTAPGQTTHAVDDIVVGFKIRAVPETRLRPAVGVRFSVRLPNAKHESGLGQDTTDFSAVLLTAKTVASTRVVANAGVSIVSEPLDAAKQNDAVTYGASLAHVLSKAIELVGEVNGRWSTRNGQAPTGTETRGVARIGARYTRGSKRFDGAILFGTTPIDPTIGVTLGFTYTFKAFSVPADASGVAADD